MSYSVLREKMVREQLIPRGITDSRVLNAFRRVPREEFVPPAVKPLAYADTPLAIGYGQTISQPYTVALMTQLSGVRSTDKVLELGAGSGYQAAILAELTKRVFTVERIAELARQAQQTLERLGYRNVTVYCGDGSQGLPDEAPFDAIIITAACREVPPRLLNQLASGGRLVAPIGGPAVQEMVRITRDAKGSLKREEFGAFRFVPLITGNFNS